MRVQVRRGMRLSLVLPGRTVALRVLTGVELDLDGAWTLPVLGALPLADPGGAGSCGTVTVPTPAGFLRLAARLVRAPAGPDGVPGGLLLCPADAVQVAGAPLQQRRGAVRMPIGLSLRAALVDRRASPELADVVLSGRTVDVSGTGICFTVAEAHRLTGRLPDSAAVFVELDLPDGTPAPAVLRLAEAPNHVLRGGFADISPADADRLVRLVFAEQRRLLAERRGH